jgi:serine/threonine-protein kinase RsbT
MPAEVPSEEHVARVGDEADLAGAVLLVGRIADRAGFDAVRRAAVMTAVSELARNILKYAGSGRVRARVVRGSRGVGVEIVVEDQGPGIHDVARALSDHYSTGGTLGLGLPGVRRLMDVFDLWSEPGKGTRVTVQKWKA